MLGGPKGPPVLPGDIPLSTIALRIVGCLSFICSMVSSCLSVNSPLPNDILCKV